MGVIEASDDLLNPSKKEVDPLVLSDVARALKQYKDAGYPIDRLNNEQLLALYNVYAQTSSVLLPDDILAKAKVLDDTYAKMQSEFDDRLDPIRDQIDKDRNSSEYSDPQVIQVDSPRLHRLGKDLFILKSRCAIYSDAAEVAQTVIKLKTSREHKMTLE